MCRCVDVLMWEFTNVPMVNLEMVGAKNFSPRLGDDRATIEPLEFRNVPIIRKLEN
jgi:hypothetical protein